MAAACADPVADETSTTTSAASTTTVAGVPPGLEDLELTTVTLQFAGADSVELLVAVADEPAERAQGLMRVTDLRDLDGMVFDFGEEVDAGFWMRDTPLPLTLIHFDGDGQFVSSVDMAPCPDGDCPSYFAAAPFRFGLEVPLGAVPEPPEAIVFGN